jgi:hypothetical protein
MKDKRPFLLWLVCLIFLAAAFAALLQVIRTVAEWNILLVVQYQPGPLYPLFSGILLHLLFLTASVILWLRLYWAPDFAGFTALLYSVWFWLDRLVLSINPHPLSGQVFNSIVFIIILGLLIASLWALKPVMKQAS